MGRFKNQGHWNSSWEIHLTIYGACSPTAHSASSCFHPEFLSGLRWHWVTAVGQRNPCRNWVVSNALWFFFVPSGHSDWLHSQILHWPPSLHISPHTSLPTHLSPTSPTPMLTFSGFSFPCRSFHLFLFLLPFSSSGSFIPNFYSKHGININAVIPVVKPPLYSINPPCIALVEEHITAHIIPAIIPVNRRIHAA